MFKDFMLPCHAADQTREAVQNYLEHVHAPLALSVEALSREFKRYTMNHLPSGVTPECALYQTPPTLATVVEHAFGGWPSIERFTQDLQYLDVVRKDEIYMTQSLFADTPQFIPVDVEKIIYGSSPATDLRIFDFIRRPAGMSKVTFEKALSDDAERVKESADYRKAVSKRVHSITGEGVASFGGDAEPYDAVIEIWVTDLDRLTRLKADELRRRSRFCDPARSITAVTRERVIRADI